MASRFLIILAVLINLKVEAQNRNKYWCFGHNAAIEFANGTNAIIDSSAVVSRGSCASIADTSGNILFYVANDSNAFLTQRGVVYQNDGLIMQNGDSLIGRAWYQEHVILPNPADSDQYFIFTAGVTSIYGFYYSIVDMSLNGVLGAVTQKNIILDTVPAVDCVIAIKHGNGRDWWVIFRKNDYNIGGSNNDFYEYLVTPFGISNVQVVSCGTPNPTGFNRLCVNSDGTKIASVNTASLVEVYDFDRCTGNIYNPITIEPQSISFPYIEYWECTFSPNSNLLYLTTNDYECVLLQYNLLDSNPSATKDTLWHITFPVGGLGAVRRAPDNKLYVSCAYIDSMGSWNYPYPDSMYNMYNMNLSVINQPDSLGAACDFQPYSFYLGGKRTYWGLPNNPDYDLGPLTGSVCDTLTTGIAPQPQTGGVATLQTTYIHAWQKLFVNAQQVKGKNALLMIYDTQGKEVYRSHKGHASGAGGYYTQDVDVSNLSNGLYIVTLVTDKEVLSAKFVKN
ncbi:MAG: T9SS type A sorting domain-containing protein [Bacteroidia bacterium]|nr:T9SS type A sorting domain-containing protein [Bacteroidia bacterium]